MGDIVPSKQATSAAEDQTELLPQLPSPGPRIVAGAIAVALAFNVGFFLHIGLPLMGLFDVGEHLLFALSGVAVIGAISFGLTTIMTFFERQPTLRGGRAANIFFRRLLPAGVVVLAVATIWKDDGTTAGLVSVAIFLISFWLFELASGSSSIRIFGKSINQSMAVLSLALAVTLLTGILYAEMRVAPGGRFSRDFATMLDGRELPVVRLGSRFALLRDGDAIIAERTDRLIGIRSYLTEVVVEQLDGSGG